MLQRNEWKKKLIDENLSSSCFFFSSHWFTTGLNYDWHIWKNNFTSQCANDFVYETDFSVYKKNKKIGNNGSMNVIVFIVVVVVLIENWNNELKTDLFCLFNFGICNQLKKFISFLFCFHAYWLLNWLQNFGTNDIVCANNMFRRQNMHFSIVRHAWNRYIQLTMNEHWDA